MLAKLATGVNCYLSKMPVITTSSVLCVLVVGGKPAIIDEIYYFQPYSEGWENGEWSERREIRPCNDNHHGFTKVILRNAS